MPELAIGANVHGQMKLLTNILTILAVWFLVTSIGPFIAEGFVVGMVQVTLGLILGALARGAWLLDSRSTSPDERSSEVRASRLREDSGMLLLFPIGVGALLNFAGSGWIWTIGGSLIALVIAGFYFINLQAGLIPGDCITVDRGGGFQFATVLALVPTNSRQRVYDLMLFGEPQIDRPVLDLLRVPSIEDAHLYPTARMSQSALYDGDYQLAAAAHLIAEARHTSPVALTHSSSLPS